MCKRKARRKRFFFEKKNQKTFIHWSPDIRPELHCDGATASSSKPPRNDSRTGSKAASPHSATASPPDIFQCATPSASINPGVGGYLRMLDGGDTFS